MGLQRGVYIHLCTAFEDLGITYGGIAGSGNILEYIRGYPEIMCTPYMRFWGSIGFRD